MSKNLFEFSKEQINQKEEKTTEELLKLKNSLSIAKRHRSKLNSQLYTINRNIHETGNLKQESLWQLNCRQPNVYQKVNKSKYYSIFF